MSIKQIVHQILFTAFGIPLSMLSQTQPIAVDNTDIHVFPSNNSQHEVHISINKTNPLNLIVSANTFTTTFSQGCYHTLDGGITWFGGDDLPENGVGAGDPSTSFDAAGRGYVTTISGQLDGYFVQRTDDLGLTWSEQVRGTGPSGNFDKEMIVTVDEMQSSPYANNFYCAWTDFGAGQVVKINRSTDGAQTFDAPITLTQNFGQGTNVQIGPNGEIYVCWADYTDGNIPGDNIGFSSSLDGGISYSSSLAFPYAGVRLTNGANNLFGNTRVNDFPAMAVDKSCGPNRGRIYIVYPEFEIVGSTRSVIRISYSDNQGNSWSVPQIINIPFGRQNWFPWIAVDDLTGLVNVIYYSLDQEEENSVETNTYIAYSTDGGQTWQNVKVSDVSHNTEAINNNQFAFGYAGDYIGIASFNGSTYAAWADNRNSTWQIYVSKVDFGIAPSISSQTNLEINNPSTLSGNRSYRAAQKVYLANNNDVTLDVSSKITVEAGDHINFYPGFTALTGSQLNAKIDNVIPCSTPGATFFKGLSLQQEENIVKITTGSNFVFAYPNPAEDYITIGCTSINAKYVNIKVSDLQGQIISNYSVRTEINGSMRKVIDVSAFPPGIYIITFLESDSSRSTKFIKN